MSLESGRSQREALVDGLMVVVLLALCLSLLDESYWSRSYLAVGLTPVVFLVAVGFILRRFADGSSWFALVALASYAPLGGLVALQQPGPWIFPTFDTMTRVLGQTFLAPQALVNTIPPVESAGTVMLVPFAIGFLAGAPATWLALRTQAPVLPVIPIVAAMATTIPLAVLVPDFLIVRGMLFGLLCVAWASARGRRQEANGGGTRGVIVGAVISTLVVAAASGLAAVLVPDNDQTNRVLLPPNNEARTLLTAAGKGVVPSSSGDRVLLKTEGMPEDQRLRFAALDTYTSDGWTAADESPSAGAAGVFRRIGASVTPLHQGEQVKVGIKIRQAYSSMWLPTVGELTTLTLDSTDGRTQMADIRYNQATSSALVVGGVNARDSYTFTAVLNPDVFSPDDETQPATTLQRQPQGSYLDKYLAPFQQSRGEPLRQVLLLAKYLRLNGAVRLSGTSSQKSVDLGVRLLGSDRISATPFQYSAVMALGASRLGVPARVVIGAEPSGDGTVTDSDVVSWVELQFADGIWRTLEPAKYVGVHSSVKDEEIETDVSGWVSAEELEARAKNIKIPKGAAFDIPEDAVIEEPHDAWRAIRRVAAAIVLGLAAVWLCVPLAKMARRRGRRRAASWTAAYVNGWQEVLDAARDRGTPIPDTWSRIAQATEIGAGMDLARAADAAVFSPVAATENDRREFWVQTQQLRRSLLAEVPARIKLWEQFNPASLLSGWERRRSMRRSASGGRPAGDEDRRAGRQQPAGA